MSLGERIKEQRKCSGLSQEKVAGLVGVSRQAVTKWETGQSAPSTENLFKLAEIFGTTVDMLLTSDEEEEKAEDRWAKRKKDFLLMLAVLGGYVLIYLAGRIFGTKEEPSSVMGWLFGDDPQQLSYLYGWLIHQKIFWAAMAISAVPALFGKKYVSFTSMFGTAIGLLIGELCGRHPAGEAYGHGHYGWAIWIGIFVFSLVMGVVLERLCKGEPGPRASRVRIWSVVFLVGILAIVLGIRASMPAAFA